MRGSSGRKISMVGRSKLSQEVKSAVGDQSSLYTIGPLLGRGGFGRVYSATAAGDDSALALKVVRIGGMRKSVVDASVKEALMLRQLRHPYIIGYRDAFVGSDKSSYCGAAPLCCVLPLCA